MFCNVKFRVSASQTISVPKPCHWEIYNCGFRTVDLNKEISTRRLTFIETFCVVFYKSLRSTPIAHRQTAHVTPSVFMTAWRLACLSCALHTVGTTQPYQHWYRYTGIHKWISQLDFSNDIQISPAAKHNSLELGNIIFLQGKHAFLWVVETVVGFKLCMLYIYSYIYIWYSCDRALCKIKTN
jgi:hypothetical protein